ncbi:MAG: TIGR02646 family protein [Phycisphaerales bacterium]|nr:TIGR02646 family protein [Phycisphaerales bacterium]
MKHIQKQNREPESFASWKKQNRGKNWGDFAQDNAEYLNLKEQLLSEQEGLCCYCEVAIEADQSSNIEHLKPRSQFPTSEFKYANLLASCVHQDSCNAEKQGWYSDKMVTPLQANCQKRFTYTQNGQIIPAKESDSHAQNTIDKLGLNCTRLRDRRKSMIKAMEAMLAHDSNPKPYLKKMLKNCREWPHGFYTVCQYVAMNMGITI